MYVHTCMWRANIFPIRIFWNHLRTIILRVRLCKFQVWWLEIYTNKSMCSIGIHKRTYFIIKFGFSVNPQWAHLVQDWLISKLFFHKCTFMNIIYGRKTMFLKKYTKLFFSKEFLKWYFFLNDGFSNKVLSQ